MRQPLTTAQKDRIYQQVLVGVKESVRYHGHNPEDPREISGRCMDFAIYGLKTIHEFPGAPKALPLAGSATWPRLPAEEMPEDNAMFSYFWQTDHPQTKLAMQGIFLDQEGRPGSIALPEIHIWLGIPETREIIDFTTGYLPLACKQTTGMDWPGPKPPLYFWGRELPDNWEYRSTREATLFATKHILESLRMI